MVLKTTLLYFKLGSDKKQVDNPIQLLNKNKEGDVHGLPRFTFHIRDDKINKIKLRLLWRNTWVNLKENSGNMR